MTKKRIKTPAPKIPVPTTWSAADAFLAEIGEAMRRHEALQAALDGAVAAQKAAFEAQAQPVLALIKERQRGLQIWAEANRAELTQNGKTKTVKLPAGEIAWRQRPPSVRLSGIAACITAIKDRALHRFLRVKEEVNKEALLAEPELAVTLPGVGIGSAGEEFVITPVGLELAEAVS